MNFTNDLLTQINGIKIDVNAGYNNNQLPDGNYQGVLVDFSYAEVEDGIRYQLKLKTLTDEDYMYFIKISEKTIKFNMQALMTSLYRISQNKQIDFNQYIAPACTDPQTFVSTMLPFIINKNCSFTLKTNKNGYQTCEIDL